MSNSKQPVHITADKTGKALSIAGGSYRIVKSGKDTGGAYAVIEMLVPPGGGPGPHAHANFEETFHILEGEVELESEDGKAIARTGDFVSIPKGGIVHGFKNKSDKLARLWCVVVPAGLDGFFEEIGKPSEFGTFEAPQPMTPEIMTKLKGISEKYGQQLFPPDYFEKK